MNFLVCIYPPTGRRSADAFYSGTDIGDTFTDCVILDEAGALRGSGLAACVPALTHGIHHLAMDGRAVDSRFVAMYYDGRGQAK